MGLTRVKIQPLSNTAAWPASDDFTAIALAQLMVKLLTGGAALFPAAPD